MISFSSTRRTLAIVACAAIVGLTTVSNVQHVSAQSTQDAEIIDLLVGDILEMLPVVDATDATYVWVLTQDGEYIESSRTAIFRKRIIQPGSYSLYAEISGGGLADRISKTFTLNYSPRTPGVPEGTSSASGTNLVVTNPPITRDAVVLGTNKSLIQLLPIDPDQTPIVADVNTERDSDLDGRSDNDADTQATFFQTDGTPLYLWFASINDRASIRITSVGDNGDPIVQSISVLTREAADAQGIVSEPVEISATEEEEGVFAFTAIFTSGAPSTPLLYTWEFGDGQQSLLTTPTHAYTVAGEYNVKLTVSNLTTGTEIATTTKNISIGTPASGGVPSEGNTTSEPTQEPNKTESGSFGRYLLLGLIFLIFIGIGFGVVFIVSRLRKKGGNLSDRLASMEETLLKPEEKTDQVAPTVSIAPAPKAEKVTTPPPAPASAPTQEEVAEKEKQHSELKPTPETETKIQEKNAPSWLKGGLTVKEESQKNSVAAQAPTQKKAEVKAVPEPQKTTPPVVVQSPSPTQSTSAGEQLKPAQPAPQQNQASKPATPPAQQTPRPSGQVTGAPAWLSNKPASSAPAPQAPKPTPPVQQTKPAQPASEQQQNQAPKPATPPVQKTPQQQTPKPTQAPVAKPVIIEAEQVTPTQTPIKTEQPVANKKPESMPIEPASSDEPVAFIRADSLEQKPQTPSREDTAPKNPPTA